MPFIIDEFINKQTFDGILWLKTEILKCSELEKEEEDELIAVIYPIFQNILSELKTKLEDEDLTKEELSEIYVLNKQLSELSFIELETKLKRKLNETEEQILTKVTTYFENLLADSWLKF
ncbi:MAG: hypothetical protein ACXAC7_06090 [Candidatus Hodarchaeales archaeon]